MPSRTVTGTGKRVSGSRSRSLQPELTRTNRADKSTTSPTMRSSCSWTSTPTCSNIAPPNTSGNGRRQCYSAALSSSPPSDLRSITRHAERRNGKGSARRSGSLCVQSPCKIEGSRTCRFRNLYSTKTRFPAPPSTPCRTRKISTTRASTRWTRRWVWVWEASTKAKTKTMGRTALRLYSGVSPSDRCPEPMQERQDTVATKLQSSTTTMAIW